MLILPNLVGKTVPQMLPDDNDEFPMIKITGIHHGSGFDYYEGIDLKTGKSHLFWVMDLLLF